MTVYFPDNGGRQDQLSWEQEGVRFVKEFVTIHDVQVNEEYSQCTIYVHSHKFERH